MAGLTNGKGIEKNTHEEHGPKNLGAASTFSKWKTLGAALALVGIVAADQVGCGSGNNNSTTATPCVPDAGDSGCFCFSNDSGTGGSADGGCYQFGEGGTGGMDSGCVAPAPVCASASVPNQLLNADPSLGNVMVVGSFRLRLDSTSETNGNQTASFDLLDICGHVVGSESIPKNGTYTFSNVESSNVNVQVNVGNVTVLSPNTAEVSASVTCGSDGGMTDAGNATCGPIGTGTWNGDLYTGSPLSFVGYSFTYVGNSGGAVQVSLSCNGVSFDPNQACPIGSETDVSRPSDSGGKTIKLTPTNANSSYTSISIAVQ